MTHADDRLTELDRLKELRKKGELDTLAYYKGLLKLAADLVQNLRDEDISEEEAKRQLPLVLVFLEEQIDKFKGRGG
ncbi:MAG TPA: hypothetical protein EYH27_01255 [Anaerolineales bacterium]|nr:hypothetical protein [Anaerolineales bacterium]